MNDLTNVEQSLRSGDEEIRRQALRSLKGLVLADTCGLLFMAMADDSWRVRKDAVDLFVVSEPDETFIARLLELLRNGENAGLRNSAVEAIVKLRTRGAPLLTRLAKDSDADVRKFVIDVMGTVGDTVFLPSLLEALSDPDVNVSAAAAEHLGQAGDSTVVPELIRCIIANKSQFFRFSALTALGRLASHIAMPQEIIALADQEILRKGVYECLGSIADESAAPVLLKGFLSRQRSSRRAAITSWYRIYSQTSATVRMAMEENLRNLNGNEVMPVLVESFDPAELLLAEAVTALLGIMADMRGLSTLLEAFASERLTGLALSSLKRLGTNGMRAMLDMFQQVDDVSRCAICAVFGEMAYAAGSGTVRQALKDHSDMVRKSAISAAAKLGMTDCIRPIAALLDDADAELRSVVLSCLQAMARIDLTEVQQVARGLASSASPDQRRDAAMLYGGLGDGDCLSLLAKDENAAVREAAVIAIGKQENSAGSGILLMALVDEDPDVRIAAAEALGRAGNANVLPSLTHAMHDEDCWVQSAVLRSIVFISREQALPVLRDTFATADGLLMITCLEMLESLGGGEALAMVEEALGNSDYDVMSLAVTILVRQGGEWLEANAERLLGHQRPEVRVAFARHFSELPAVKSRPVLTAVLEKEEDTIVREQLQKLLDGLA